VPRGGGPHAFELSCRHPHGCDSMPGPSRAAAIPSAVEHQQTAAPPAMRSTVAASAAQPEDALLLRAGRPRLAG
jgi:hypothetical protein